MSPIEFYNLAHEWEQYFPEWQVRAGDPNIAISRKVGDKWIYISFDLAKDICDRIRTLQEDLSGKNRPLERFEDLVGKMLIKAENLDDEELVFTLDNGKAYKLYHEQDCCESVRIADIVGDLEDLIGLPILMAEAVSNRSETEDGSGT